jgi:preprotein translocase subunit SecF
MAEEQIKTEEKGKFEKFHDKYYKLLLLLPIFLILFSLVYMVIFYETHHDIIYKDISLSGGTTITLYEKVDVNQLNKDLSGKLDDISIREISDIITREQKAVVIETKTSGDDAKKILEDYLGYTLTDENSSFEFTGSTLSESFYNQLLIAMTFAFLLMAIVVFILFRTFVPSLAVILSAFADILMPLVVVDSLGIKISSAGIVAFLMLIGYSVDTDILLTNRVLKREGEGTINKKLFGAFKTGITMTSTALVAVLAALIIVQPISASLAQIFTIISIGLFFDIFNTWVTNVSILKWYIEKKEKKI